jgi:adenylate kinase
MLREAVAAGTPLGIEAKRFMDQGALVPDEVVIGLVDERLSRPDAAPGYVLDGFPRTVAQAQALDALLRRLGQDLDRVVFFDVSRDELLRRLTGRRVCRQCGTAFHLVSAPPKVPGRCDQCGGELYQREDDAEATVGRRLDVYQTQTAPLLDYYRTRGLLVRVAGEGPVDRVAAAIQKAVKEPVAP